MLPTSGPFSYLQTQVGGAGLPGGNPTAIWFQRSGTWYRQRRPYNLPLTYASYRGRVKSAKWSGSKDPLTVTQQYPGYDASSFNTSYDGYTRAWNRFRAEVSDSAQLGLMLAERRQSMSMLENRLVQLARFSRALSRFRFGDAADALGVSRKDLQTMNLRRSSKAFANNFLEFRFGWSASVNDVYSACSVLSKDVDTVRVRARGRGARQITSTWSVSLYGGAYKDYNQVVLLKTLYLLGADVRIENPNLALAENLGLVNPALFVYERVPFSFVLNWFVTVEEFLSNFTAFWGYRIDNPFTTLVRVAETKLTQTHRGPTTFYDSGGTFVTERCWMDRRPGAISGPPLRLREPWVLSPVRGLTAASLLLQRLKGH